MRTLLLFFIAMGLMLTACQTVSGSGKVISEERQVTTFDGVSLDMSGEVTIIQSDEQSVLLEAEDNLMPYITTEVRNGVLHIGSKDNINFQNHKPFKFTVSAPNFTRLEIAGSGIIISESINSDDLLLDISGSGDIMIDDLQTSALDVSINGSGDITTQGESTKQTISINGSGNYVSPNLMSKEVDVSIGGAGEVKVWATDSLDIDINGSGDVVYKGTPRINQSINGSGDITQLAEG